MYVLMHAYGHKQTKTFVHVYMHTHIYVYIYMYSMYIDFIFQYSDKLKSHNECCVQGLPTFGYLSYSQFNSLVM